LNTAAARYQDWLLHYEMSRHYANLSQPVLAAFLASRTALYPEILGALLAHQPAYFAFQLAAVILNSLWLWPAGLILRRAAPESDRIRLLAVGVLPVAAAYTVYTWPWGFAAFFLLGALWAVGETGRLAAAAAGLGLGGAVLAH